MSEEQKPAGSEPAATDTEHHAADGTPAMQAVDAPQSTENGDAEAQRVDAEADAEDVDIDSLVNVVLDSTKVSNHSATVAAESTERMAAAVEKLSKVSHAAHPRSLIALSVPALLMLAMVASVFLISINLGSRFSQADNTLMAIGRRLVDIKGSLETVGKLETALGSARSALQEDREMTRKLAAWAAILAVPTAIAGIYGMNFRFMPELEWEFGYVYVIALMVLSAVGPMLYFRKRGWLK